MYCNLSLKSLNIFECISFSVNHIAFSKLTPKPNLYSIFLFTTRNHLFDFFDHHRLLSGDNYTSTISGYENSPVRDYVIWFLIFALFWMNSFIQGVSTMTICGAFAAWYWTETDVDTHSKGNMYKDKFPVVASLKRTCRYHLGTVSLGSLIIAICQFLRVVLGYLDEQSKEAQKANFLLKVIFKCLACFLACFEKCVRYITRKSYIVTAIKGTNFCSSGMTVFHLLLSHGKYIKKRRERACNRVYGKATVDFQFLFLLPSFILVSIGIVLHLLDSQNIQKSLVFLTL